MKTLLGICLALSSPVVAPSQSMAGSHIAANVPDGDDFAPLLKRDVAAYLEPVVGGKVTVEFELLRDGPTQSGAAYPKFYAWIRAYSDGKIAAEGAVRAAAVEKKRFEVTHYFSKAEIARDPHRIDAVFPQALLAKIRSKAGVKAPLKNSPTGARD